MSRPRSWRTWRAASRKGSDSMSPTVPPISVMMTSGASASDPGRAGGLGAHPLLDLVGDVRDDLDGVAEVLAAPLLGDDPAVDLPRRHVGVAVEVDVEEALVVADVEVGLGAVVGDEHLAVLERVHRPGVDVEVGVELLHRHPQTACAQQVSEAGGGEALAERGGDAPGHEDLFRLAPRASTLRHGRRGSDPRRTGCRRAVSRLGCGRATEDRRMPRAPRPTASAGVGSSADRARARSRRSSRSSRVVETSATASARRASWLGTSDAGTAEHRGRATDVGGDDRPPRRAGPPGDRRAGPPSAPTRRRGRRRRAGRGRRPGARGGAGSTPSSAARAARCSASGPSPGHDDDGRANRSTEQRPRRRGAGRVPSAAPAGRRRRAAGLVPAQPEPAARRAPGPAPGRPVAGRRDDGEGRRRRRRDAAIAVDEVG